MAKTSMSDTPPPASFQRGGKIVVPFNMKMKTVTDSQTGKTRTQYEYDESEGNSIEAAQQVADSKVALKLAAIADMTYDELDKYIEVNVTTLASAKTFMKKLAKVVLALVKQMD